MILCPAGQKFQLMPDLPLPEIPTIKRPCIEFCLIRGIIKLTSPFFSSCFQVRSLIAVLFSNDNNLCFSIPVAFNTIIFNTFTVQGNSKVPTRMFSLDFILSIKYGPQTFYRKHLLTFGSQNNLVCHFGKCFKFFPLFKVPRPVTWNGPLLGFIVQYRQDNLVDFQQEDVVYKSKSNLMWCQLSSLNKFVNYEFRVIAYNTIGRSPASKPFIYFVGYARKSEINIVLKFTIMARCGGTTIISPFFN